MSFLNLPRINFSGQFEADVNTVNNDVRNFAVDEFQARFQTEMKKLPDGRTEYNGWWNPKGSNRFSLIGCAVTGVVGSDGRLRTFDGAPEWTIQGQFNRTAGKIVDLDPQFQMASALWGHRFGVVVTGGETLVAGDFFPASFRDLFFGRLSDASGQAVRGSSGASARFTGALENLVWGPSAELSPILAALKEGAAENGGRLSFSLVTYGYNKSGSGEATLTGSVIGSIGPWRNGEPMSFAPGRRFAASGASPNAPFASASNVGYSTALASENDAHLTVDFGICLPLQLAKAAGDPIRPLDLGPITVAVAKQGDVVTEAATGLSVTPGVTEGQALDPGQYEAIAVVSDYDAAWLHASGGVVDFDVPTPAQALIADHPLLLLIPGAKPGTQTVAIREAFGGLWARGDNFVNRIDTAPDGWVGANLRIWAMRWGRHWVGAPLVFSLPPISGQGDTGDPNEAKPPQVVTPDNNLPLKAIVFPTGATTGDDGVADVTYWAADPDNPRRYIDGQIYQVNYAPAVTGASPPPMFEVVAIHVRDAYTPPETPSWETDVKPVLVQYSNLYPIMSHALFSLAAANEVSANARLLHLAFTLPPTDANYMPATRDLSAGKLRMIVDWLKSYLPAGADRGLGAVPPLPVGQPLPAGPLASAQPATPAAVNPAVARAAAVALGRGVDGKTAAVRAFLENAARQGEA